MKKSLKTVDDTKQPITEPTNQLVPEFCLGCGHIGRVVDGVCRRAVLFGDEPGICGHRCAEVKLDANQPPERIWIARVMLRHNATPFAVYVYDETTKHDDDIPYARVQGE